MVHSAYRFEIDMSVRRIRYVIAFVTAVFLANSAAVAAWAFIGGLSAHSMVSVQAHDTTGVGPLMSVDEDMDPCITHCAQNYKNPQHELATNAFKVAFPPAMFVAYFLAKIRVSASLVALAPQAAGPALIILFCNLRN